MLNKVPPDQKDIPSALPSLLLWAIFESIVQWREEVKKGELESRAFLREGYLNNISKLMSCELIQRGPVGFAPPFYIR